MDPVSLIVAALAAGAAAAAKDTAQAAVKDAYQALKSLLQQRLAGQTAATVVLEEHAKDPPTYDAPLKKKLAEAALDKDDAVLQAARELLTLAAPAKASPMIQQTISNVNVAAISGSGDASIGTVTGQPPPKA